MPNLKNNYIPINTCPNLPAPICFPNLKSLIPNAVPKVDEFVEIVSE